jgi:alpha-L-arabinofuranosidase
MGRRIDIHLSDNTSRKVNAKIYGSFAVHSEKGNPRITHIETGRYLPHKGNDVEGFIRHISEDKKLVKDLDRLDFGTVIPAPLRERLRARTETFTAS